MKENFKNRGHFCNYCRKILYNKIAGTELTLINLNAIIWYAWDFPQYREEILSSFINLYTNITDKEFHKRQKALLRKYGFKHYFKDKECKAHYKEVTGISL